MRKVIEFENEFKEHPTAQEVFDFVAERLLAQGRKSRTVNGCLYRHPEGLKCAAGFLLTDEEAERGSTPGEGSDAWCSSWRPERLATHDDLIGSLQHIHDFCPVFEWHFKLENLAEEYNLDPGIVERTRAKLEGGS